ncbi:HAMP domain-containing histidine kinase [Candidatus Dojkabacteria bacterium]|nr:HAMP domain-containing histidine kinase [Candidatus Dojkabacteria bacterium]
MKIIHNLVEFVNLLAGYRTEDHTPKGKRNIIIRSIILVLMLSTSSFITVVSVLSIKWNIFHLIIYFVFILSLVTYFILSRKIWSIIWDKLTRSNIKDEEVNRRVYMIRAFLLSGILAISGFALIFLGLNQGWAVLMSLFIIIIFVMTVAYIGSQTRFWNIVSYLPTIVILWVGVRWVYDTSGEAIWHTPDNLLSHMSYTCAVILSCLFLKRRSQVITYFVMIGIIYYTMKDFGVFDLWVLAQFSVYYFLIYVFLGFLSSQFQKSLNRSRSLQIFTQSILDSSPGLFYVFDAQGKLFQYNINFKKLTKYSDTELKNLKIEELFKFEKEEQNNNIRDLIFGKELNVLEAQIIPKRGRAIPCLVTGQETILSEKQLYIGEAIDISKQKKAEQKAKEINDMKDEFLKIISHQLRTPLSAIKWNLESLISGDIGKTNKKQQVFLKGAYESDKKVISRINDLIMILDIGKEEINIRKETAEIQKIIEEIINNLKERAKNKGLQLIYNPPQRNIPKINIDPEKIKYVLNHIVNNAIDYTMKGTVTVTVELENDKIHLKVTDTGIGIPKEDQKNIFKPFFRAQNAYQIIQDASGIGLAISKFFIEAHNGKIGFNSKEGQGSTFWVKLQIE